MISSTHREAILQQQIHNVKNADMTKTKWDQKIMGGATIAEEAMKVEIGKKRKRKKNSSGSKDKVQACVN